MKSIGKFLFVLFIIILLICVLAFAFYFFNLFPQFNNFIDSTFFKNKIEKNVELVDVVEEEIIIPEKKLPFINGIESIINSELIKISYKNDILDDYVLPNISLSLEDDGYALSSMGDFSWTVNFEYPIISNPVIYDNKIGLIIANNDFLLLDINTGLCTDKFTLPRTCALSLDLGLLPKNYAQYPLYNFKSEEGEEYTIVLHSEDSSDFTIVESKAVQIKSPLESYNPSETASDFIISSINGWGFEEKLETLPKIKFFLEDGQYVLSDNSIKLFLINPKYPGKYNIGLTNENGSFINDNAVVAVFTEDGALVEVSLGYVANEPNVSVYLENEIYYIVAFRILVDETQLKEVYLSSKMAL